MFPLKRIVCPTDFSEPSLEGLRNGIKMAESFDAELLVVYVIEPPSWSEIAYSQPVYTTIDWMTPLKEESIKKLNELQSEMIPEHVRSRLLILEGNPAETIVKLAAEESANLIVIATHGYSGFNRFVFGSVTERVVRTATCPVLTIRPAGNR
jgi:nucleotide-binding universal stress UspA family protein